MVSSCRVPRRAARVGRPGVGFPPVFVKSLDDSDVQRRIREALSGIPPDAVLEDLSEADFDRLLIPDSLAWAAWDELVAMFRNAKASAPLVGASKLLAAKRPRLVPLEDSYVRHALGCSRREVWQVIHRVVQDPHIRTELAVIRQQIPAARHITVHRVLDVIAWRERQGHCSQCQVRLP